MTEKGMPAYIPGDTIRLRLDIEHQANLTEVWAVLRRQAEPGETDHPLRLSLTGALDADSTARATGIRSNSLCF